MSSQSEEGLDGEEVEVQSEDDVIEWSDSVEDQTLAVLEGDLEEDPVAGLSRDDLDGREGVAKVNTEKYITDFEESFEFRTRLSS
jgi:hypothetical protein